MATAAAAKRVFYFCTTSFKGAGHTWFHELKCTRIRGDDPRVAALYKDYFSAGRIVEIDYAHWGSPKKKDLAWEEEQIKRQVWDFHRLPHKLVVVEEPPLK